MTIRVMLADDQELLRTGFRLILEAEPDINVIAEAVDGADAVRIATRERPDVVLMDIRMPIMDGVTATRKLTALSTDIRVLILTTFDLDEYVMDALRAGAAGFLLKDVRAADLVQAVRVVAAGDGVVAPTVTRRLLERFAQLPPEATGVQVDLRGLTEREVEVVRLVARGLSNQEIAASLVVSETTVKTHVHNALTKLDLRDRVQLAVFAYDSGLVRPRPA
jgi:DNA-binding NarL/FixJ family response regulator